MLLYDWTKDPHHTLLRISIILKILHEKGIKEIEYDRLRILDFILAKPTIITEMVFDKNWRGNKSTFKNLKHGYNSFPKEILFHQMKDIFDIVINSLEKLTVIVSDMSISPRYNIKIENLSINLQAVIETQQSINFDAITLIKNHLIDYPLLGRGGLKDRSKLMEYKYDNH